MAVVYRNAEVDDAAMLGMVHTNSWQAAYEGLIPQDELDALDPEQRAEEFRAMLDPQRRAERGVVWIVAEEEGALLGHAGAQFIDGGGHLHFLYLDPSHWDKGVGHELHELAMDGLRSLGATSALLKVLEGNQRAINFYERHGWAFTGERMEEEIAGIAVVDVQMEKPLV